MEELNQFQASNLPASEPVQAPQFPQPSQPVPEQSNMSSPLTAKKKNNWFWIVVSLLILGGILAWLYVKNMAVEAPVVQQPEINKEAREDMAIDNDIREADLGDLDREFNEIDKDLNSL